MSSSDYAVEKLTNALRCLATHPGDARERLVAASYVFPALMPKHFPPELQKKWEWVIKELHKRGPMLDYKGEVSVGSVENTMARARKKTAARIAEVIYELYWSVSENKQYL